VKSNGKIIGGKMKLRKNSFLTVLVLVVFSTQVLLSACNNSPGKEQGELSEKEKEFYKIACKLIDEKEFADVIELSDKNIKKEPNNAMYHQFKGLALVLKYADSTIPFITCKSCIKDAVQEFYKAKDLDPENEDKALAAIVLAYLVNKELDQAKEIFEPAIKKFPKSPHLNYVGIQYYEKISDKSNSMVCKNFVAENNPEYNGKPVFGGIALVISVGTLVKILTAAIIISYIKGFKTGMKADI
jgi:tetratricopeptide (TPR) repeat protein